MKEGLPDAMRAGQIWREKGGRYVKILDPKYEDIGPSWTYCTKKGKPVPDSKKYPTWFQHYCDGWDFWVWDRFTFVSEGEPVEVDQ